MARHSEMNESKFERAISYVLITGVVISLLFELIGILTFYRSYRDLHISENQALFLHGRNFFSFLIDLFRGGYFKKPPVLLMALGIAILILTPYVRVVMSVFYFAAVRNTKYVLITLFVLIILTLSLAIVSTP